VRYSLGIDVGTTAVKAALISENKDVVVSEPYEYELIIPRRNFVELDVEKYWQATKAVINEILEKSKVKSEDIVAVSISSQGETFVPLDEHNVPLRRAIVWLDNRSKEEAEEIKKEFGIQQVYKITGQPEIVPTWPATKILWLKKNEPEVFRKVKKYLLIEDYLIQKLTGKFVTDYSVLTSTLLFDIQKKVWWKQMLEFLEIGPDQLPEPKPSARPVGKVSKKASGETGLSQNTIVSTGAFDHAASAVGTGNTQPGVVTEYTGSVLAVYVTTDKPTYYLPGKVPCHCHAVRDKYLLLLWCQTAGSVLRWFRDNFCQVEKEMGSKLNLDPYDLMGLSAEKIPPGSEGLIILPHLLGAASPEFNPQAKGNIFGIGMHHSKAHFIRAIMESVAYMLRKNLEVLEEIKIKVKEIHSIGGGARSKLWSQIKSDVIKKPIRIGKMQEASAIGAAILAGVGGGVFKTVQEGSRLIAGSEEEETTPVPGNAKIYGASYRKYLQLYRSLENMFNGSELDT